jgi:tetratricopeptide (TPR) repeat protein
MKYSLVFILIVVIGFSSFYIFCPDIFYTIGKTYEKLGKHHIANIYYDKILKINPKSPLASFTTERKFLKILSSKDFNFLKGFVSLSAGSSGMSGYRISQEDLEKLNDQYEKVINGSLDKDLHLKLQLDVALLNWFGGKPYKSIEILKQQSEGTDPMLLDYQKLYLSCMYLMTGNLEKIPTLVNEENIYTFSKPLQDKASSVLAYYYFLLNDHQQFKQYIKEYNYQNYSSLSSEYKVYGKLLDIELATGDLKRALEKNKSLPSYKGSIHGKMTLDSNPFPYQIIILKKYDDTRWSSNPWTNDYVSMSITGKNGDFSFKNIPSGVYTLLTYVPWPLVKDKNFKINGPRFIDLKHHQKQNINIAFESKLSIKKVIQDGNLLTFEFDKVKDADYYRLEMGEVYNKNGFNQVAYTYYSDTFTTNHITIDPNKNREKMSGGIRWDDKGINPYDVFGAFYHEGNYTYKITAFNENGIIGDSFGIWSNSKYPTISISGASYTKADQLLIKQFYDAAIKSYKNNLKQNPKDPHALRVLSRLYTLGYLPAHRFQDEKEIGVDIKKAIYYTEKLVSLAPNKKLSQELGDLYMKNKEYDKALSLFQKLKPKDYSIYTSMAKIYKWRGDFNKALENYYASLEELDYAVDDILTIEMLIGHHEKLPSIARLYNHESEYIDYVDTIQASLKYLQSTGYADFYKEMNNGNIDIGEKILSQKKDRLSYFYKALLLLVEDTDRKSKETEYTSNYHKFMAKYSASHPLTKLLRILGKESFGSDFGE